MHYHVFVNSFVAVHSLILSPCFSRIRQFRNEKATGAEMCHCPGSLCESLTRTDLKLSPVCLVFLKWRIIMHFKLL